ncbi:MAG TPA: AAA domain-containing protein [Puia sp.]|jgi:hypothetical protein|nr:AAA domain-containing protein [Puia sp.]
MPIDPAHYATILRFWRSVETFTLPDIPAKKKTEPLLLPDMPLPWDAGELPAPKEGRKWRHTLYFHIVPKTTVINHLARLTGSNEFLDGVGGETCLSALTLDSHGQPFGRGYSAAAFIYGIKAIREKRNAEVLTDLLITAQRDYCIRFGLVVGPPPDFEPTAPPTVTWTHLNKELEYLKRLARDDLPSVTPIRCISEQVAATTAPEAPFLNSYYLQDLDCLIRHPQDIGRPLRIFLSPDPHATGRIHLLEPELLRKYVQTAPPPGRWPSNPCHGLYAAQYAALNIALPHTPVSSAGPQPSAPAPALLGINGPPGTGKTTLLREIIAAIITDRARRLLATDPANLFQQRRIQISERAGYYRPEPGIIGSDGIVVSGNNNAAIENISHELPLCVSIDKESFPGAEYFSAFATNVREKPCWGMLSADLGRSQKRSDFIDKFWFNGDKGFGKWLRRQYEDHDEASANAENLRSTATRLRSLLSEYDIAVAKVPAPDFGGLCREDIHRATPYASEHLNILRSHIFLESLRLHEFTISCNARCVYQNLASFVDMLKGKWKENIDGHLAEHLWNTFFFCVPVVSVTLASFQRQFQKLGQGSIGWLLLDEAGQASPPSVCGALWRCRQCILIGDTRQIPPVVTIPATLSRFLQNQFGIAHDDWSPSKHSAQYLADRVTTTGAYIQQNNTDPIWTGIPLRAHRRCHEPMFSIANTIAYNGQMVQATPIAPALTAASAIPTAASAIPLIPAVPSAIPSAAPSIPHIPSGPSAAPPISFILSAAPPIPLIPSGPSGWFDIRDDEALDGHAIARELEFIDLFLQPLSRYPHPIFLISPFRSIADLCSTRYEKIPMLKCGTIHTFQGKEADIVILVLGTHPDSIAARKWAASGPNILNVAVTRARHRLYVVGNRATWSRHNYYNILAATLPVRPHGLLL